MTLCLKKNFFCAPNPKWPPTEAKRPRKRTPKPIVPTVRRLPAVATATSATPTSEANDQEAVACSNLGPPPELNSLKRLTKEVNSVVHDINSAKQDGGLELARGKILTSKKTNLNFRKSASKKVEFDDDERLFTSLTNLSIASSSEDSKENRLAANYSGAKAKVPELKLENYFTPYQGVDVCYEPSKKTLQKLLSDVKAEPSLRRFRIQDEIDIW